MRTSPQHLGVPTANPGEPLFPPDNAFVLLCQYLVTGAPVMTAGGDSGGPVFRRRGDGIDPDVDLAGIVIGRTSPNDFVFSAIGAIFFENQPPEGFGSVTH
jgi:hypothetical protein